MISSKLHKTQKGFMDILSIYASMNRGISAKVKAAFLELKAAIVPSYSLNISSSNLSSW